MKTGGSPNADDIEGTVRRPASETVPIQFRPLDRAQSAQPCSARIIGRVKNPFLTILALAKQMDGLDLILEFSAVPKEALSAQFLLYRLIGQVAPDR